MIRSGGVAAILTVLTVATGVGLGAGTEASAQTSARYNAARDACVAANNARIAAEQAAGSIFPGPRGEKNLERMIDASDDSLRRDIQDARDWGANSRARGDRVSAAVWDEIICYGEALLRNPRSGAAPAYKPATASGTTLTAPVDAAVSSTITESLAQADGSARDALAQAWGADDDADEPSAPAVQKTATPSAAYQRDGDCIHMDDKGPQGATWQVVSTCSYKAFGSFCYDDDGPFSCAKRMAGSFGPLDVKGRRGVGTSPKNGAGYRITWCDYEDWLKGTCGKFEPWTAGSRH